jgi:membrane-bound metal-dependent hydrolase YbcI (DUF457 family)
MHEHSPAIPNLDQALAWPLLSLLTRCPNSADGRLHDGLTDALLQHLQQLSITAYEQLIAQVLQATGYEHVQVLRDPQRKRRSHKGRTAHGGVDLIAQSRCGLAADAVLVQVKQYERAVSRRFVDELRGALLRTQSRHALLITTSRFSPAAVKAAREDHVAPLHLIDGDRLCSLLMQHEIGVRRNRRGSLQIDGDFFERLRAHHGVAPTNTSNPQPPQQGSPATSDKELDGEPTPSAATAGAVVEKGGHMMGRTHALIGIAALWLLELPGAISQETMAPLILLAVIGALAPDLDASESKLKQLAIAGITPLAPLSQALHQSLGHRGLLHSLAGLGLFTVLCALPVALWLGWTGGAALILGYASHIVADSATKSGVPLLYPRRKRYHLLPTGWRLTTGSLAEEALFPLLALSVLWLLFSHLYLTS